MLRQNIGGLAFQAIGPSYDGPSPSAPTQADLEEGEQREKLYICSAPTQADLEAALTKRNFIYAVLDEKKRETSGTMGCSSRKRCN